MPDDEFDAEPLLWAEAKSERPAEIIQQINSKNAKLIACGLVLSFILYHGVIHLRYGTDSCTWLLSDGRYKGDMEWQPYGCLLHRYSQTDTRRCMRYLAFYGRQNRFVFVGDSRIHDLYTAFWDHLTGHESKTQHKYQSLAKSSRNFTFVDYQLKLTIEFVYSEDVGPKMLSKFQMWRVLRIDELVEKRKPSVGCCKNLVVEDKLTPSHAGITNQQIYLYNRAAVDSIDELVEKGSRVLWVLQEPVVEDKLTPSHAGITNQQIYLYNRAAVDSIDELVEKGSRVLWVLQEPVVEDKLTPSHAGITNQQIYLYNRAAVDSIDELVEKGSRVLWVLQEPVVEDKLTPHAGITNQQIYLYNRAAVDSIDELVEKGSRVLWVLQEPVVEDKLTPSHAGITNQQIYLYNRAAVDVLRYSRAKVWSSSRLLVSGLVDEMVDGYHLGASHLRHNTQLLLNAYCNDHMNYNDGTCCASAETYTTLQMLTFAVFGVCTILGIVIALRRYQFQRMRDPPSPAYKLITSLAKLGVILAYFYLCDRTNFFMKENKYYSPVSFWLPIGYVFALGLFFTEDSRYTKILHREQTDEWKGWMQLVILIYHMTGASSNLQIYNHVQILVSAYLFLTGYGHFYYLWHRADGGVVRFFQVMFRLNMLAVCLCLCMNRPYQFYTFTPLASFWVMMIYLVLCGPPRVSATSTDANPLHYLYLILKMVVLFSLVVMLYMSEVFFEKVFVTRPWKALFVTTDDDIHDWWYRWKLDRYSMSYGVVFGMGVVVAQRLNLVDDNNHSNVLPPRPALAAVFLALVGIGCSVAFALLCNNKLQCNEVHSYTVFVPIVSYVVLRNISGMLRTRYSSLFAWFGRISLELFLCQHHIWLAADTHGVLVLLPGYPVLNSLITAFIFVCASHEIHQLTRTLMPFAVPSDWKLVLRNVMVFFLILVPIGIHDGMF
ncbi:N-acetylneuraminate 9-O-acetyltransferase-like [Nilaparvata lugens]|uniref:N-acetylneuraminate 9-O-acetyltransferase-like n=1 Tax=Nilaparvata lugens TaxID=108931 RepID=UPI00193E4286|nr:N-acetylneuraminate 9-O-acetyltransferase-like [Nilaparvata lugens]